MRHPYFDLPRPIPIGHRGAAGEAPENTLVSFARALELGAPILESDVHATRDGELVLLHDDEVDRTSDGSGKIGELSFAELQRLDAGHRFSPDGGRSFPYRGCGLRVPSLAEAFAAFPGARFNLELKEASPGAVERLVSLVAEFGREAITLLTSGRDEIMQAIRAELRRTGAAPALGASTGDVVGFLRGARDGLDPPPGAMALQIPESFGGNPLVTRQLVDYAHAHDVQVHVWTVNEPEEMNRLFDLDVDGIVSDFPGRVLETIAKRRAAG